jgi:alpha-galactosidase
MRGLRTIPVFLDICKEMEELCPDVMFLQYVNPMAMNTWAINRTSKIKTVGLCHSVQGTAEMLAEDIGVPIDEINYICAGINHMAFYLKFERNGEDLYPKIRQVAEARSYARGYRDLANHVRYEILRRTGYFVTESSEHFSEYVPWFIKRDRPDLIEQYEIPLDEYITRCELQIAEWEREKAALESGQLDEQRYERSQEYGSLIIHSMETGIPRVVYGNVANRGLIDNLPQGCCVEVPCLVDKSGLQPTKIGMMPPHLAAMQQTNINVQSLVVEAALTRKREHIYHAAMLDPHTAAELSLDQIWSLVDELIEAHGDMLPEYG